MKKLLVAVLAFALFAPAFAVENVQVTGDIQTIGFAYEDHGITLPTLAPLNQNTKFTSNRVIFGLGADLIEDVRAKVSFAHSNVFGDDQYTGVGMMGPAISSDDGSGSGLLERTYLTEAYVAISNIFDAVEVKVGRQFYGDEKSPVLYFGPTYGYADPITNLRGMPSYLSAEGVSAVYNGENYTLTAAYFSLDHDGTTLDAADDVNLGGLDLAVKVNDNISASAYVYDFRLRDDADTSFGFWGVKPSFETENIKLAVEYARNYAANNDKGWLVKADAAVSLGTDNMTFTPRATYYKSEKHFQALGNYRPGLMFGTLIAGGLNSMFLGPIPTDNWEVFNAGLCMKFANLEKWGFGVDFYTLEHNGSWNGNSWEAKVVYDLNEYVAFNLTGAVLSNIKHFTGSPFAAQLGMNIKF